MNNYNSQFITSCNPNQMKDKGLLSNSQFKVVIPFQEGFDPGT
jgi:hypothetical protein